MIMSAECLRPITTLAYSGRITQVRAVRNPNLLALKYGFDRDVRVVRTGLEIRELSLTDSLDYIIYLLVYSIVLSCLVLYSLFQYLPERAISGMYESMETRSCRV
jgi:hypothetical protein